MKLRAFAVALICTLHSPGTLAADSYEESLQGLFNAASDLERGLANIPAQWLEMESIVGWERMMLVFGYADNASVCDRLRQVAKADAPAREFRCSPAN